LPDVKIQEIILKTSLKALYMMLTSFLLTFSISTASVVDLTQRISHFSDSEEKFFNAIGHTESSNDYTKVNPFGYIGRYQFGESVLIEMGYYKKDGTTKNDWQGDWTGKDSIYSYQDLLDNAYIQDKIAKNLAAYNWQIAKRYGIDKYVGRRVNGVKITKAGIIAGMHLTGFGGVRNFILHGDAKRDGNGISVTEYMTKFHHYKLDSLGEV
jgi:hypothetical protein